MTSSMDKHISGEKNNEAESVSVGVYGHPRWVELIMHKARLCAYDSNAQVIWPVELQGKVDGQRFDLALNFRGEGN